MTPLSRADLHVHSRYSDTSGSAGLRALRKSESFTEPLDLYRAQRARGMDLVTITDHNTLAGSLAIADLPGTFLSTEFDTWFPEEGARVHVVALGLDEATFAEAAKACPSVYDLVACLREADVTHYLAHPLFDMTGRLTPETVERMLLLFNVLEGRNGSRTSRCNGLLRAIVETLTPEQFWAMAERHGIEPYGDTPWRKALVGGSDDHSGLFSASAYTTAGGDGTAEGFLRAVAAGDCDHAGADGDARLLAHSIYAASFWRIREILRLDEEESRRRALGLLRKGFGRIGRDVPVLEKAVSGVRSIAPGLYRDGDPRGKAWEDLLEREIGSLIADPDGINAVDAKELNRRLFTVAQRLADDVMSLHLQPLLSEGERLGLKRRLQSVYAVGMVAFLELPYYFAWSFQSRDRGLQEQLRAWFLGERRHTWREKAAVLCSQVRREELEPPRQAPPAAATSDSRRRGRGRRPDGRAAPRHRGDADHLLGRLRAGARRRRRLPRPRLAAVAQRLRPAMGGPAAGGGRRLPRGGGLHRPPHRLDRRTGAAGARRRPPPAPAAHRRRGPGRAGGSRAARGDVAGRLRRRYLTWFYGQLDEAYVPTRDAARALVAGGVDPERVTVLPAPPRSFGRPGRPGAEPGRPQAGHAGVYSASASSAYMRLRASRRISRAFCTSSAEPAMPTCLTAAPSWKTA